MGAKRQFCTMFLAEHFFGIPVQDVQEMIRAGEMTQVPLAPPEVRGLVNLRGQLLTTLDLRCRLGLDASSTDQPQMNVVLRTADGLVGLLVDRVGEVLEVDDDQFEAPPATLSPALRRLIVGAYKLSDRLLLILNTENVVDISSDCEITA